MSAIDDGGWETVANVQFQTVSNDYSKPDEIEAVPPPPEFLVKIDDNEESNVSDISKPSQYVYGLDDTQMASTNAKAPQVSAIEAEIREQKMREDALKKQISYSDTSERVSSPSSHTSDEGFVDKANEEEGFGEKSSIDNVIFEPSPIDKPTVKSSEAKIAMEIRELREREAELRAIREMRQKELLKQGIHYEEDDQDSSSSRDVTDDHLASLTTTTDEGNFSEYGDPASSDKSSDGSNSRIMSPDLINYGSAAMHQRKITVKPYQDDDVEEQPVYTIMHKESVIEREIRLSKEREDAYRREKGLIPKSAQKVQQKSEKSTSGEKVKTKSSKSLTATIIQKEIEEAQRKEKELKENGLIKHVQEKPTEFKVQTKLQKAPMKRFSSTTDTVVKKAPPKPSPTRTFEKPMQFPFSSNRTPFSGRLTRSLSTNNLSAPLSTNNMVRPRGLMQKFIASKGKITTPTFISSQSSTFASTPNGNINMKPMNFQTSKLSPRSETNPINSVSARIYKRTHATAEEKIQEELREMKKREEELKRHRAKTLGLSQHNASAEDDDEYENSIYLPEVHNLRNVLSNPNLLDCDQPLCPPPEKTNRRKSALIAQWEDRIQQTET